MPSAAISAACGSKTLAYKRMSVSLQKCISQEQRLAQHISHNGLSCYLCFRTLLHAGHSCPASGRVRWRFWHPCVIEQSDELVDSCQYDVLYVDTESKLVVILHCDEQPHVAAVHYDAVLVDTEPIFVLVQHHDVSFVDSDSILALLDVLPEPTALHPQLVSEPTHVDTPAAKPQRVTRACDVRRRVRQ